MDEQMHENLINSNTQQPILKTVAHLTFLPFICTLYHTLKKIVITLLLREVVQKRGRFYPSFLIQINQAYRWLSQRTCIRFCWEYTSANVRYQNLKESCSRCFYDFLLGFCHLSKTHYVWWLLVIYFKNDSAIFREQEFYFQVISAKCGYW